MFRWRIWSCIFSSSCFYFRFNLKYIQLNSVLRIIKAYQKSSDFVSQRSLSSSEQLYVYYFHILHFWGFVYYPRAWSNSENNRNQRAFHFTLFHCCKCAILRPAFETRHFYFLTSYIFYQVAEVLIFLKWLWKERILVMISIHATGFLEGFVIIKLYM